MLLIDDILFAPIKGVAAVAKKIHDLAMEEHDELAVLKKELLYFQMLYATDKITKKEYEKREREILEAIINLQKERNRNQL